MYGDLGEASHRLRAHRGMQKTEGIGGTGSNALIGMLLKRQNSELGLGLGLR